MLSPLYATTTYAAIDFNSRHDTSRWYRVPCAEIEDMSAVVNFAGSARVINGTEWSKKDLFDCLLITDDRSM